MPSSHYETVAATDGGSFDAYCVIPGPDRDRAPAPGVLLFQEIFGINDNIRGLAEKLADHGYLVLAPDMFWRLEPRFERKDESGISDAMAMVQRLDFTLARADIAATLAHLRALPGCTGRVGAVGFCLGGTLSYLTAATAKPEGRGIDAAVSYYGSGIHSMLDLLPAIECPMLMHYGDADPYIAAYQIDQVAAAIAGRTDVVLHRYPAGHAFSNWDAPSMYRREPAELAWQRTLEFFGQHLV